MSAKRHRTTNPGPHSTEHDLQHIGGMHEQSMLRAQEQCPHCNPKQKPDNYEHAYGYTHDWKN